jgi:DNA-binding transcriptional ArsR family regulator
VHVFEVVADPSRRRILDLVREHECSVGELVEGLAISQPAVSKQLRILREGGFVASRIDGQRRMYSLVPEPLAEVEQWIEPYRRFWADRLDALTRHVEEMKQNESQ